MISRDEQLNVIQTVDLTITKMNVEYEHLEANYKTCRGICAELASGCEKGCMMVCGCVYPDGDECGACLIGHVLKRFRATDISINEEDPRKIKKTRGKIMAKQGFKHGDLVRHKAKGYVAEVGYVDENRR